MLSIRDTVSVSVDPRLCTRCGACESVCPSRVYCWEGDERVVVERPGRCIGCGHCVAVCPTGAFSHTELPIEGFAPLGDISDSAGDEFSRLFMSRRSCREFAPAVLDEGRLEPLFEAARFAPTSTNSQNVRVLHFEGREQVRGLIELTSQYYLRLERQLANPFVRFGISLAVGFKTVNAYRFRMPAIVEMIRESLSEDDRLFYGAPQVIVLYASGLPHLAYAGCNLAAMQIMLAAHANGLAACYNGYALTALVRDRGVRKRAGIAKGYTPGAVLALGEPARRFHRIPPRHRRRVVAPSSSA